MSCLAKIYTYATNVVANLTGGLKKITDYPTSLRITTLSTQEDYVDPAIALALALGDVNLDDDADNED